MIFMLIESYNEQRTLHDLKKEEIGKHTNKQKIHNSFCQEGGEQEINICMSNNCWHLRENEPHDILISLRGYASHKEKKVCITNFTE